MFWLNFPQNLELVQIWDQITVYTIFVRMINYFCQIIVVDPGIGVKVLVSGASPGLPDFSESSVEEGLSIPV